MKPDSCAGCSLEKTGSGFTQVEIGAHYEQARLLLVGEASGEAEARDSLPFRPYAQSGSLLADSLRRVHIERSEIGITNCIRCRPPKDYLIGAPYEHNALYNCSVRHLDAAIRETRPNTILALGETAFRMLADIPKGKYSSLLYLRGYVMRGKGVASGIPVIGTHHPSFIRRGSPHLTPLLHRDIRRSLLVAQGKLCEGRHFSLDPEQWEGLRYQVAPTVEEAWEYANSIDPDKTLAFDIETPLSTRSDEDERTSFTDRDIKLFQCTQHRGSGIALPFRDEFIAVIREIINKVALRVGFNNWSFDDPVLAANGIDLSLTDDAMVMFGYYYSDLPKNLQAAAQSCGFPFPYKHLSESNLEFYGCCDVDATLCVYEHMKALLEREGMFESYRRYFRDVWPILKGMSQRGIPIDETRRQELKSLIEREDQRVTVAIQALVPSELRGYEPKQGLKRTPKDVTGMIEVEIPILKEEKCQCLKKNRPACPICCGSGTISSGSIVTRWARPVEFNPNSPQQVKAFIKLMKHPVPKHAKRVDESGEAAETTEMKELERLAQKTKHPIYKLLIEKRMLTKTLGTYVEGWKPSSDGCVHTTYTFQTATWQTSSRAPNVQNGLKHGKTPFQKELVAGFNSMQRASAGRVLINFDFKSFHALTTAHDFNIPDYARLARIDIHSFITAHFVKKPERDRLWAMTDQEMAERFKEWKKDEGFKFVRDFKAKRAILGIQFGMGFRKLYQLNRDDFESETEAKAVWEMVYHLFPKLRSAQQSVRARASEDHRLVNKFGAVRHFHDVERWDRKQQKMVAGEQAEEAVAFLPASHAFGHVRDCLLEIRERGFDERYGLCNSIHDSFLFHCVSDLRDACVGDIRDIMQQASRTLIYPEMAPLGLAVEAEATAGESMANLH